MHGRSVVCRQIVMILKEFRKIIPFILKNKFIFIFLKRENMTEVNCSGSWKGLKQYLCMNIYIAILLGYLTLQCE